MADILDLFPSLAATLPSRREGYAAEPIGRRRQVVPNRRKPRAPIPIPGMLADIRRLLDSELPKINRRLGKMKATLPAASSCSPSSARQSRACGVGWWRSSATPACGRRRKCRGTRDGDRCDDAAI